MEKIIKWNIYPVGDFEEVEKWMKLVDILLPN